MKHTFVGFKNLDILEIYFLFSIISILNRKSQDLKEVTVEQFVFEFLTVSAKTEALWAICLQVGIEMNIWKIGTYGQHLFSI